MHTRNVFISVIWPCVLGLAMAVAAWPPRTPDCGSVFPSLAPLSQSNSLLYAGVVGKERKRRWGCLLRYLEARPYHKDEFWAGFWSHLATFRNW